MAPPTASNGTLNVGFLTIVQEPGGYLGGYLVTNCWGRPLEFRVSSAVQPNRVQQILYAGTLEPYICADLIGKALVEKASVQVQLVVTDRETVLDMRLRQPTPVIWLARGASPAAVRPGTNDRGPILCHPQFTADLPAIQEMLAKVESCIELAEPFARIREAMGEARKMGVTRSAA
jgi:hypothetical protein